MNNSKKCLQCRQTFYNPKNDNESKRWKKIKFCSHKCYWKSLKGKLPASGCSYKKGHKRNVGVKYSEESRLKNKLARIGNKNWNWKGEKSLPCATHVWVTQHKGKASTHKCIDCSEQAREWSNKDHSYKRILSDYSPRCQKCHRQYDIKYNNYNKPNVQIICKYCKKLFTVRYGCRNRKYCSERCYQSSR